MIDRRNIVSELFCYRRVRIYVCYYAPIFLFFLSPILSLYGVNQLPFMSSVNSSTCIVPRPKVPPEITLTIQNGPVIKPCVEN